MIVVLKSQKLILESLFDSNLAFILTNPLPDSERNLCGQVDADVNLLSINHKCKIALENNGFFAFQMKQLRDQLYAKCASLIDRLTLTIRSELG